MMMWKKLRVLLLLGMAPVGACSCEDDVLLELTAGSCEPSFPCPEGQAYRQGQCQLERCTDTDECCPGQRCVTATGQCVDRWKACTDSEECDDITGQECIDFRGGQFCGYPNQANILSAAGTQSCESDLDCPSNTNCTGRRCLAAAPCSGGCPEGQVCDIDSNACFPYEACTETCGVGEVLVLSDPDVMSGPACCLIECECATLPAIPLGQVGFHSDLTLSPGSVLLSAYDQLYGDLVFMELDRSSENQIVEYIDGFPSEGPVVANPSDRRQGRILPGPDVGEYSSIATDASGNVHIAYYDGEEGRLKYARREADTWLVHVVDSDGKVGLFTSIALSSDGRPMIAYMVDTTDISGTAYTGLRWAEAESPVPAEAADWIIENVDLVERPPAVCGGGCSSGSTCVDLGRGPACVTDSPECIEECTASQVCADDPSGPRCVAEIPTSDSGELPEGTGLFASAVATPQGAAIAYYDRLGQRLRLAEGSRRSFSVRTLHQGTRDRPQDVGAHASLAIAPDGRLAVAYMDMTNDDLLFLDISRGDREIIDDGVTSPDLRQIGADASLVFDARGNPAVAYQDASLLNLMYARRVSADNWQTQVLRGAPGTSGEAAGFYASQEVDGSQAWISSVAIGFDERSNLNLDISLDVVPLN